MWQYGFVGWRACWCILWKRGVCLFAKIAPQRGHRFTKCILGVGTWRDLCSISTFQSGCRSIEFKRQGGAFATVRYCATACNINKHSAEISMFKPISFVSSLNETKYYPFLYAYLIPIGHPTQIHTSVIFYTQHPLRPRNLHPNDLFLRRRHHRYRTGYEDYYAIYSPDPLRWRSARVQINCLPANLWTNSSLCHTERCARRGGVHCVCIHCAHSRQASV